MSSYIAYLEADLSAVTREETVICRIITEYRDYLEILKHKLQKQEEECKEEERLLSLYSAHRLPTDSRISYYKMCCESRVRRENDYKDCDYKITRLGWEADAVKEQKEKLIADLEKTRLSKN